MNEKLLYTQSITSLIALVARLEGEKGAIDTAFTQAKDRLDSTLNDGLALAPIECGVLASIECGVLASIEQYLELADFSDLLAKLRAEGVTFSGTLQNRSNARKRNLANIEHVTLYEKAEAEFLRLQTASRGKHLKLARVRSQLREKHSSEIDGIKAERLGCINSLAQKAALIDAQINSSQ